VWPNELSEGKGLVNIDNDSSARLTVEVGGKPWLTLDPSSTAAFELSAGKHKLGFLSDGKPAGTGTVTVAVSAGKAVVIDPFGTGNYSLQERGFSLMSEAVLSSPPDTWKEVPAQLCYEVDFCLQQAMPLSIRVKASERSSRTKIWKRLPSTANKAQASACLRGRQPVYAGGDEDLFRAIQIATHPPVSGADVSALCDFLEHPPVGDQPQAFNRALLEEAGRALVPQASLADPTRMLRWLVLTGPLSEYPVQTAIKVMAQRIPPEAFRLLYVQTPDPRCLHWVRCIGDLSPPLQTAIILDTLRRYPSLSEPEAIDRALTGQMEPDTFVPAPELIPPFTDFVQKRDQRQYLWLDMWGLKLCRHALLAEDGVLIPFFDFLVTNGKMNNLHAATAPLIEGDRTVALISIYPKLEPGLKYDIAKKLGELAQGQKTLKPGQLGLAVEILHDSDWQIRRSLAGTLQDPARTNPGFRALLQREQTKARTPEAKASIQSILDGTALR
jgi:hypothetical protein